MPEAYARFGQRTLLLPPARVNEARWIEIGDDTLIHELGWIEVAQLHDGVNPRLSIGSRVSIGRFCHIACLGEVVIEDDVLIGDGLYISDTYHGYEDVGTPIMHQPLGPHRPVRIRRGAFLGHRVHVLQGVTVGENAVVGTGSVVVDDVPPRSVAAGNPARVVRRWDEAREEWVTADR